MKKGLTEIVFILDRSGSMGGLEADTIGGFNSMMERQKKEDGQAYVSTILFDNESEVLYDRVDIREIPVMTEKDYYVRGCTALLDAIGGAIHHIKTVHRYAREEDRPEKTMFIITTDGCENASREYGYEKVRKMVQDQQKKDHWEFLFIGANIDAITEAQKFGIRRDRAVDYVADECGTATVYESVGKAIGLMRTAPVMACAEALSEADWAADIKADYKKRGRRRK